MNKHTTIIDTVMKAEAEAGGGEGDPSGDDGAKHLGDCWWGGREEEEEWGGGSGDGGGGGFAGGGGGDGSGGG